MREGPRAGVLHGVRVLEFEAIGPVPLCCMVLADLGADVLRIERPAAAADLGLARDRAFDVLLRGRRSLALDLKSRAGAQAAAGLAARADIVVEGFRPGVMERLGLGPDTLLPASPRLVYGRMTGWGQSGPAAAEAGHDINYLAATGLLSAIGHAGGRPVPPLNLVADYGGGAMVLAIGLLAALRHAGATGQGQVVDAAMVDGAALLGTHFWGLLAEGLWTDGRGGNLLDSGRPWYDTYACRDGGFVAVGAIEERFYLELVAKLGLDAGALPGRGERDRWPELRRRLAQAFLQRSRDEWAQVFAGSDACVTPVVSLREAPHGPHVRARGTFTEIAGVVQPAPAPRFSATPGGTPRAPPQRGEGGLAALRDWGFSPEDVARLRDQGLQALS